MPPIDLEPHITVDRPEEGLELRRGELDDPLAPLADEVLVVLVGEVVDGTPVPQMDVIDDARLFEGFESPVYGRDVHGRKAALHTTDDVVGRYMTAGLQECLDDRLTRYRSAPTRGGEPIENPGHTFVRSYPPATTCSCKSRRLRPDRSGTSRERPRRSPGN